MRIAVCDDNSADTRFVKGMTEQWLENHGLKAVIETFSSAESFFFRYAEQKDFDILLLDVEMGTMDGVTLAKRIRMENETLQIVFITGYADYMAQGYEVEALQYLLKPVRKEKLFPVLDRAVRKCSKQEKIVLLPMEGEMLRLPVSQIFYIEAFSHSVTVATEKGSFSVKQSISEMEKLLGDGFVRCHRSYLVALKYISRLSRTQVILDSGKVLPLSRSAAPFVHKAFVSYYREDRDETL